MKPWDGTRDILFQFVLLVFIFEINGIDQENIHGVILSGRNLTSLCFFTSKKKL
jgi:hypothetical protein